MNPLLALKLGVVVVVGLIIAGVAWHIHSLSSSLALSKAKYTESVSAMQLYANDLKTQNDAFNVLKAKSEQQAKQVIAANTQSVIVRTKYITVVKTIQAASVPHTCEGALKWQSTQMSNLAKGW